MIGLILAAGAGRRLRPYTDTLPKALVPVDGDRTVMDLTLANFAEVGLTDVAVVVGYRAEAVRERQAALEVEYGVTLHLVHNSKAEEWNNAYSLWCARELLSEGVILANGDTVHPVSVERALLDARGAGQRVLLALDTVKKLADEEMKVVWTAEAGVRRITKLMEPAEATGEYIGVTLIEPEAGAELADALRTTFERDPQLYYEDGYQELVDRGFRIDVQPIGEVDWVEIDNHEDLARARRITGGGGHGGGGHGGGENSGGDHSVRLSGTPDVRASGTGDVRPSETTVALPGGTGDVRLSETQDPDASATPFDSPGLGG